MTHIWVGQAEDESALHSNVSLAEYGRKAFVGQGAPYVFAKNPRRPGAPFSSLRAAAKAA